MVISPGSKEGVLLPFKMNCWVFCVWRVVWDLALPCKYWKTPSFLSSWKPSSGFMRCSFPFLSPYRSCLFSFWVIVVDHVSSQVTIPCRKGFFFGLVMDQQPLNTWRCCWSCRYYSVTKVISNSSLSTNLIPTPDTISDTVKQPSIKRQTTRMFSSVTFVLGRRWWASFSTSQEYFMPLIFLGLFNGFFPE